MRLILASASPRRAELLRSLGLKFDIIVSDVIEHDQHPVGVQELAVHNARIKARDVARHHPDDLVIGADTIVVLAGEVYGKPADLEDARRMLRNLSGQNHQVITGVCLSHHRENREKAFHVATSVQFLQLDGNDIERYLAAVNVLDKAGAYAIQEGPTIVASIDGSYSNVVGLPLERFAIELGEFQPMFRPINAPAKSM